MIKVDEIVLIDMLYSVISKIDNQQPETAKEILLDIASMISNTPQETKILPKISVR